MKFVLNPSALEAVTCRLRFSIDYLAPVGEKATDLAVELIRAGWELAYLGCLDALKKTRVSVLRTANGSSKCPLKGGMSPQSLTLESVSAEPGEGQSCVTTGWSRGRS